MMGCANILRHREYQRWKARWTEAISQNRRRVFDCFALPHNSTLMLVKTQIIAYCLLPTFQAIQSFDFNKKLLLYDLSSKWVIIKVN